MKKYKNFSYEEYAKNNTKKLNETSLTNNLPYKNLVKTLEDILFIVSDDEKLEIRRKEYIKDGK
jgi:hypothetical protein